MRVIFWSQLFWPHIGGVESFAMRLLPRLRERGHVPLVITSHGGLDLPDQDLFMGTEVYRLHFQAALAGLDVGRVMAARQRVAAIKRVFRPELVHVNLQDPGVFFHLLTLKAWPCPTLLTLHGELGDCRAGPGTVLGQALHEASWVTAVSQALLDDVRDIAAEVTPRSSLIHNAVPAVDFTPSSCQSRRILCVGRQVPEKGFDLAIAAFARVHAEFPDARLVFASDGPERVQLERQARALGINAAVDFLGWLTTAELNAQYRSAQMVLMPSRWREGFGLVAMEAAVQARPVVATRVGGLPEVVADDETGLLVDPENSAALAAAILGLLRDPARAARLGLAARTRALREFDFDRHAAAYDALYRRLALPLGDSHAFD